LNKYKNDLYLFLISRYSCKLFFLSNVSTLKYMDKINWSSLSYNTNIPYQFFEKYLDNPRYADKINLFYLSGNTNIPYKFFGEGRSLEKYIDTCRESSVPKINWYYLSKNIKYSYNNENLTNYLLLII
jgi:hypothetical protein